MKTKKRRGPIIVLIVLIVASIASLVTLVGIPYIAEELMFRVLMEEYVPPKEPFSQKYCIRVIVKNPKKKGGSNGNLFLRLQ